MVRTMLRITLFLTFFAFDASLAAAPKQPRTDFYGDPLPPGASMRLGTIRMRHVALEIAFAADGKSLISFSRRDRTIRHWDVTSGRELQHISLQGAEKLQRPANSACAGKTAALSKEGLLVLWDASTGRERRRIEMTKTQIQGLAVSPSGDTVAAVLHSDKGESIRVWDAVSGKELRSLEHPQPIHELAFSRDGKLLGAAEQNLRNLHLWEVSTGKRLRMIPNAGWQLGFSPDGSKVAAVAMENGQGVLKVWNVADGSEVAVLPKGDSNFYNKVRISPDNRFVAVGGVYQLLLFNIADRKLERGIPTAAWGCVFSPDGKTLASASACAIHLWDTATWREISPRPSHDYLVSFLAATPDGRRIVSLTVLDDFVHLWDVASGKPIASVRAGDGRFHRLYTGVLSADGKRFATGCSDGTARVWELDRAREMRQLSVEMKKSPTHAHPEIAALNFVSGGNRLAAVSIAYNSIGGFRPKYQLDVWDLDTGKGLVKRALPMENWPAIFTRDGRTIVFRGNDRLLVQDVATGLQWATISGGLREPIAWSPDGQILAATVYETKAKEPGPEDPRTIVLTELASGKTIRRIQIGKGGLPKLAYSPDGQTLAATTADGFCVWDTVTGKEVYRQPLQNSGIKGYPFATSLTFLPHGDRLATGLWDGTILIWDLEPKMWHARRAVNNLASRDLERLWEELAGEDTAKAYHAEWALAAVPAKVVPFLKSHLRPAAALNAKQVQSLIADLDSPEFAERDAAEQKLASFAEQVEPALRQALKDKPSLEARKRLEALHAGAVSAGRSVVHSQELLRTLRAIRVLEHIGDSEAQKVLQKLAGGDSAARATHQAKEALQRLRHRQRNSGLRKIKGKRA